MRQILVSVFLLFLVIVPIVHLAHAGQVVMEGDREWARQALAQEQVVGMEIPGNTLGVLYFHNTTGNGRLDVLARGLSFMLMTDLSQVEGLSLVERVRMQALMEEMDLGVSGLVDAGTAPRVGRLLGAHYLVGGELIDGAVKDLGIASDVLEVPKEELVGSPGSEGEISQLFEMEKELVFKIIELLKIELTPEERLELSRPITRDIDALMNMVYGIQSSDLGNYFKAQAYYREALRRDPQFGAAKEGIEELKRLNLVSARQRSRALAKSLGERTSETSSLSPDRTSLRKRDPGDIPDNIGQIRVQW